MTWVQVRLFAMGVVFLLSLALTYGMAFSQGLIKLKYPSTISLPRAGLAWLPGEDFQGACQDIPANEWTRKSCGPFDLVVHADGPSGSGRYWILTVGIDRRHRKRPDRGVCLETSTLGWRTLQWFKKLPLPWADDLDKDGNAELIIWDSFPIKTGESMAEFGLIAWVYRINPDETFSIDWNLTRRVALELADAYRNQLEPERMGKLQSVRNSIARMLEKFVSENKGVIP